MAGIHCCPCDCARELLDRRKHRPITAGIDGGGVAPFEQSDDDGPVNHVAGHDLECDSAFGYASPELAGDTANNYEPAGRFLVLCGDDFDQATASEAQLGGAAIAFACAAQQFRLARSTLGGRHDFADTAYPGANLYAIAPPGTFTHVSKPCLPQRLSICNASAAKKQP